MISDRTLEILAAKHPDRKSAHPWAPGKEIKCADLLKRYKSCKENGVSNPQVAQTCAQLKRFTHQCFVLEPKYFDEFCKSELTEEQYFQIYMEKVGTSLHVRPPKRVWKQRDLISD